MVQVNFPRGWLQEHFDKNEVQYAELELRMAQEAYYGLVGRHGEVLKQIEAAKRNMETAEAELKKIKKKRSCSPTR